MFEDRVEMFFSRDPAWRTIICLEIDSRGRVFDYRASYYRKFDPGWSCKGLETAALRLDRGYVVEGRIPRATLAEMGLPRLAPGGKSALRALSGRVQPRPQRQAHRASQNDSQPRPQARRPAAHRRVDQLDRPQDPRARFPRSLVAGLAGDCRVMSQNNRFISASQAQPPVFAGIDLGGTNIKVGVVDDLGRPLCRLSIPTETGQGAGRGRATDGQGGDRGGRAGRVGTRRHCPRRPRLARHDGHPRRHD